MFAAHESLSTPGKRRGLGSPNSVSNLVLNLRFRLGMVYPALALPGLVGL